MPQHVLLNINRCNEPVILLSFVLTTLMESHSSTISRAILKPLQQFVIPNSDLQTLKSVDFWCKLLSCLLLQSHDSDVLSYSDCKIAKIFWGFAMDPAGYDLQCPPDSPAAQRFFSMLHLLKNGHPLKNAGYSTAQLQIQTNVQGIKTSPIAKM